MMTINLVDFATFAAFAIYTIALLGLLTGLIITRKKLHNMRVNSIKAAIEAQILGDELDRVIVETSDEANESFIKFLSDSRDWAYTYIEDTQEAITNYRSSLVGDDPVVSSEARERLFSMLPESSESKD